MRAKVMKKAWKLVKEAQAKFGGSSLDYLSDSMRTAWQQVKLAICVLQNKSAEFCNALQLYMESRHASLSGIAKP